MPCHWSIVHVVTKYLDIQLSLVIENAAHGFLKPNIIDIKLGTILWDEAAPPAKKERMENTARRTTSGETGIRLTGFQVCHEMLTASRLDNCMHYHNRSLAIQHHCRLSFPKFTEKPSGFQNFMRALRAFSPLAVQRCQA